MASRRNGPFCPFCLPRPILKFYYCSGSRIATGCGLDVEHLRFDDKAPNFIARLKGGKRKEKGLNHAAVSDITEYLDAAGITKLCRRSSCPMAQR